MKPLEAKIKLLFRTGGTNMPHASNHVQYSDSDYPNRLTEDVIIELVSEALQQDREELREKLRVKSKRAKNFSQDTHVVSAIFIEKLLEDK